MVVPGAGAGPSTAGRYAASTGDAVRPAAFTLAVAYLVVALPPALLLPSAYERRVLGVTMVAGAVSCALIGWSTALVPGELGDVVHWFLAGLAGVPTATSLISLAVLAQPFQTVNLMLTLVAATALIHVRRAAVAVAVVVVLGWLLAGLLVVPRVITLDTVSGMGMAVAVAVILHLSRQRTVARLDEAHQRIAAMAATDELTGLGNRRALMEGGRAAVTQARRQGRGVTLLYIDVDGLKQLNDSRGHVAGDRLLASVAGAVRAAVPEAEVLARIGGDEFAVMVSGGGPGVAAELRQRLAAALADIGASASCGAAHLPADDPDGDLESLLDRADLAMYAEKERRRRGARVTSP
jgi:diguanylate cyclase (GGDEF)-like protein